MPTYLSTLRPLSPALYAPLLSRAPSYDVLPDGGLRVSYPRRTVHHREVHAVGLEFIVEASIEGEHRVDSAVSAANLPKPRHGSFQVTVRYDHVQGPPITTIAELNTLLHSLDPYASDDDED